MRCGATVRKPQNTRLIMKIHSLSKIVAIALLVGGLIGLAGCATSGYRTSERTAATLQSLAAKIETAGAQMDIAVTELNGLVNNPQPDLRPQYDRFAAAVHQLSGLSNSVHKTDGDLLTRSKLHFDNWEKELAAIQNEAIRSSGQARKLELQSRFDAVRNTCLNLLTSFAPVQSDLGDVNRFLNSDLTTGGLTAIRDTANRITQQATPVRQSVGNLTAELRSLSIALLPQNGVSAAPASGAGK